MEDKDNIIIPREEFLILLDALDAQQAECNPSGETMYEIAALIAKYKDIYDL